MRFWAPDGVEISGTFAPAERPIATALLSGGTGIPRRFYQPFADHLAAQGIATLTYDFRGVGDSRPDSLRGFAATKKDWGRLDSSAAFAWLEDRVPSVPRFIVGHSVGGQLLGLLDDADRVDAVVTVAASFGYWRHMPAPTRYAVGLMWYVGVPLTTRLFGYLPAKRLGLGEDLPSGVAREWARWGKRADYFTQELGAEPGFAAVRCPWKALQFSDDTIATSENAAPLLALYRNAAIETVVIEPAERGFDAIGHLGFFSRQRARLWPEVSDWLTARSIRAVAS